MPFGMERGLHNGFCGVGEWCRHGCVCLAGKEERLAVRVCWGKYWKVGENIGKLRKVGESARGKVCIFAAGKRELGIEN